MRKPKTFPLQPLVRHNGVAPMWFVADQGTDKEEPGPRLTCPCCGSSGVRLRVEHDCVTIVLPEMILEVRPEAERKAPTMKLVDSKKNSPGIAIPMECVGGHRWNLDFDQDGGGTRVTVNMHDECYDELYPDVKKRSLW